MRKNVLLLIITFIFILSVCGTVAAANNNIERVSISTNGSESNYGCSEPSISSDGRYIAFSSYANNLVENDTNGHSDIFVHDRVLNITERNSISSTGTESNGDSFEPSISADGSFVAFVSHATNLVDDDTNDAGDIFVYDRLFKLTKRISLASNGEQSNSNSNEPSISGNGNYIAFTSWASNLVENDTNDWGDVFVYNRITGTLERISISNNGNEQLMPPNSMIRVGYEPSISDDGRYVAFTSYAENLAGGDNNNCQDIFLHDRVLKTTKRVSISCNGHEANGNSENPSINSNGRYIAFTSDANNLVEDDSNPWRDIFVHDTETGITEKVSIFISEETISRNPSISGDGHFIAFEATKGEQVREAGLNENSPYIFADVANGHNIFLHDRTLKTTNRISTSYIWEEADSSSYNPSISDDGSFVAFSSYAGNLVPGDSNHCADIFVYNQDINSSISGIINPGIVKSGDEITVRVNAPNSVNITALILGETLNLNKGADVLWYLSYTVPNVSDGYYDVLLTSTDNEGHQKQINLNFIVDNTIPTISGTVTPNAGKKWDPISINALTSSDTMSVTASILGEVFDLYKQSESSWDLYYTIPDIDDGIYPILLAAKDKAGNQNNFFLSFTVDNKPPTVSGTLNPETVKTFDKINITATSDPDTSRITALIFNQTYDLIKQNDTWNLQYMAPYVLDGNYPILLTAKDSAGNQGTFSLNFNVLNPIDNVSPVISGIITHATLLNGVFRERPWIDIQAFSDPDTVSVTASIVRSISSDSFQYFDDAVNITYTLTRQEDGSWLSSSFSWLREGTYTALLTAKDLSGNHGNTTINFNVENIIPAITTISYPERLKSGDLLTLNVNVSPDAKKVYASTPSGFVNLEKQPSGLWSLQYTVPQLGDGDHTIWITILYGLGWVTPDRTTLITADSSIRFTVDNTPPYISSSANPNPLRSGDALEIKASGSTRSYFKPDDTANITATILGQTFNMKKLHSWSDWWRDDSGSDWNIDYVVPNLPDGVYTIHITATDNVDNQRTISLNFTVDNAPPIITATINPDTLKFIDFSGQRRIKITAQSSPDTKAVHAYFDGSFSYHPTYLRDWLGSPIFLSGPSSQPLNYLNGYWTYEFGVPHIITIGTHYVKLIATDYAGNKGIIYISFTAVDFSGSIKPPSGWSGIGIGGGGSSGTGGSSGNGGRGSQGGPSRGSSGSGSSTGGSSGGSSEDRGGGSGDSPDQNEPPTSPDYTLYLIILLVVILLLALIFLWYIGALSVLWFFLEIILFAVIRGFLGLIGIIMKCLAYIGWLFLKDAYIIINPFAFILEIFKFSATPSIPGAIQLIINLLGGRFNSFAPLSETIGAGLYSYGIYEFVDSVFKLGDRFKKWLGFK
ncbi:MAG: Ig-like domain-containing protein [Methanobacterium sp.]